MSQIDITQVVIETMSPFVETPSIPGVSATTFDLFEPGEMVTWSVVAQISDSGEELRSKTVKPAAVVGCLTDANLMVYGYDVSVPVVMSDLEDGLNSSTGAIPLPDTADVAQSPLQPLNVANATVHTIRVAGIWDGTGNKNRVDQILYQQAVQGVRR